MFNPDIKLAHSKGIDLPIFYWYLAGRICGEHIEKCLKWRKEIRDYYKYYEKDKNNGWVSYPFAFLDPLNTKEFDSIDKQGLTSHIPPNAIYDGDKLSVETTHGIIANMDDFFEEGIDFELYSALKYARSYDTRQQLEIADKIITKLQNKILNRRENIGTIMEVAWALYLQKPLILIVPEKRKEIYEKHPFTKRASVIVTSVKQLIKEKHLESFYKRISGAIY